MKFMGQIQQGGGSPIHRADERPADRPVTRPISEAELVDIEKRVLRLWRDSHRTIEINDKARQDGDYRNEWMRAHAERNLQICEDVERLIACTRALLRIE